MAKLDPVNQKDSLRLLLILCGIIFLIWLANFFALKNVGEKAAYGEMFGVINSLFAGLAFAGIIYTIHLQRRVLQLQRNELKETRQEFEIQNKISKKERFESTFFQMVNLHHEIVKNLEYTNTYGKKAQGREIFKFFLAEMQDNITQYFFTSVPSLNDGEITVSNKENDIVGDDLLIQLEKEYITLFEERFQNCLGHYFRNLYHIYKFVHFSDQIEHGEKKFYAGIIRAQLSEQELESSVFNAITEGYGYPNFLYLMKEYDKLQNMNWGSKYLDIKIKNIYDDLANEIKDPFRINNH